jgi:hypothetical protein
MGRPKGFVPAPCSECGNRGRHKVDCVRSGAKPSVIRITQPYVRRIETRVEDSSVEGGLPVVHAYISLKQNYKCDECGELLELGRQHWTEGKGKHLCIVDAAALEQLLTNQVSYATIAA